MRHNRRTLRLGRNHSERRAMLENMVTSLLVHQEIKTTLMKAKAAQRLADKVITLSKDDTLASRRRAFSVLQDHQLTSTLFKVVGPRFKNRKGGYTRILHLSRRKGDGATMALLQLTEKEIKVKASPKSKAKTEKHDHSSHAGHSHPHSHEEPKKEHTKAHEEKRAPEIGKEKTPPQKGFFKNISRFFRNKGGA